MKRRTGRSGGSIRGAHADSTAIANTKRLSPLPLISSSPATHHPPLTKTYESERYNVNLTLLRTPKPANHPALAQPPKLPTPINNNTIRNISDARDLLSSRLESLKREMENTHSGILKEMEASSARLSKRLKIQTQSCTQHMDEAERDWKQFSARLNEDVDEIQATCTEIITEAQASGNRICKTSIPEMMHSVEKSLEGLRSRYGLC